MLRSQYISFYVYVIYCRKWGKGTWYRSLFCPLPPGCTEGITNCCWKGAERSSVLHCKTGFSHVFLSKRFKHGTCFVSLCTGKVLRPWRQLTFLAHVILYQNQFTTFYPDKSGYPEYACFLLSLCTRKAPWYRPWACPSVASLKGSIVDM